MIGAELERVFREASGRIVGALAARFRDLALAEDAFSEACARALAIWPAKEVPIDPPAWLYQVAVRAALDELRRRRTQEKYMFHVAPDYEPYPEPEENEEVIPDERLRLTFICCHPAVGIDARAALTLRLVCGLTTLEIARAFLVPETTMAQRLSRAKNKIADAGIPFDLPQPKFWPERLEAVLATIEIAYSKAHEDAAASGPHAHFSTEMLALTRTLVNLMPAEAEPAALAALIRFAEDAALLALIQRVSWYLFLSRTPLAGSGHSLMRLTNTCNGRLQSTPIKFELFKRSCTRRGSRAPIFSSPRLGEQC